MGEENITFADLSHVISKEFKVLEDKIDAKFASYRNELRSHLENYYYEIYTAC